MVKYFASFISGLILMTSNTLQAQAPATLQHSRPERPRLVVGLVVDQMCWDYLYRYSERFEARGFKRLLEEGYNCHNTRINYIPSVTAIGHASVYTGSVPNVHGIAGNNFYIGGKPMYCTEDKSVQPLGQPADYNTPELQKPGQMSPRNMLSTTIADELRLATNFTSRIIGIALKDRGAILPAGHSANAAYWFDDKSGNFITSTYYMDKLPRWVEQFNRRKLPESYLRDGWKPLYALRTYKNSTADANDYERAWGDIPATLPLDTRELMKKEGFGVIRTTPMGNDLTFDMARAAIEGEELGSRKDSTDFLALSLSSTDYIGHRYATYSVEVEDTYLRLDKALADFFAYLDRRYGKDGYLFFLTADHAAAHNNTFLRDKKLPEGSWRTDISARRIDSVCRAVAGLDLKLLKDISSYQIFFDEDLIDQYNVDRDKLYSAVARVVEHEEGIAYAVRADRAELESITPDIKSRIINGYNRHRSGAIFVVPHPSWQSAGSSNPRRGTNHAVWSPYDTHIPLIFMGKGIRAGHLFREVNITDIAPTLAYLLKTQLPNGCVGRPIVELLGN